MITIKQQFIKFLKDNNAYEQYLFNFNKIYPKNQYLSKLTPENFIDRAFTWCYTNEGWQYWFNLSDEWQRYYTQNDNLKVL